MKITRAYRCMDDCLQTGCPGHTLTLEEESTSGIYSLTDSRTEDFQDQPLFDTRGLEALTGIMAAYNRNEQMENDNTKDKHPLSLNKLRVLLVDYNAGRITLSKVRERIIEITDSQKQWPREMYVSNLSEEAARRNGCKVTIVYRNEDLLLPYITKGGSRWGYAVPVEEDTIRHESGAEFVLGASEATQAKEGANFTSTVGDAQLSDLRPDVDVPFWMDNAKLLHFGYTNSLFSGYVRKTEVRIEVSPEVMSALMSSNTPGPVSSNTPGPVWGDWRMLSFGLKHGRQTLRLLHARNIEVEVYADSPNHPQQEVCDLQR